MPSDGDSRFSPIRPRRSLGQSFLVHNGTADSLIAALRCGPQDAVLEIGPGKGMLTRRLARAAGRVVAVEVDRRLVELLRAEFGDSENVEVVHRDFLECDLAEFGCPKVIGNLPYNISSQIVFRLLDVVDCWREAVLTTQREFARRVLAGPGSKENAALSVMLERVCERKKLFDIRPERFRPRPEVVSTALLLLSRQRPLFVPEDEQFFRRVVKVCFAQRRKTVANNLVAGLGLTKNEAEQALIESGVDPRVRAESLGVAEFGPLVRQLGRFQRFDESSSSR